MTHGYVDSHIIAQALRLRLKDETSVILSDLYLQILQYIEMHKTTLTDIIINDREHFRRYAFLIYPQYQRANRNGERSFSILDA